MASHLTEEDLVLYRYEESPDAAAVARHLEACQQCRAEYAALDRVLGLLETDVPEPPPSYERDVWIRVEQRLAASRPAWRGIGPWLRSYLRQDLAVQATPTTPSALAHARGLRARLRHELSPQAAATPLLRAEDDRLPAEGDGEERTRRARVVPFFRASWVVPQLALAATIALLLAGSFAIDRVVHPSASDAPRATLQPSQQTTAPASLAARDRVLFAAVGEHLQRSELMLTEFNNVDAQGPIDLSEQQAWAEDLVSENRLYRQSAAGVGQVQMASLLDDLERVLLEVAHAPANASAEELEQMRTRLDTRDVLFKVRVAGAGLRQREDVAAMMAPPISDSGSGL